MVPNVRRPVTFWTLPASVRSVGKVAFVTRTWTNARSPHLVGTAPLARTPTVRTNALVLPDSRVAIASSTPTSALLVSKRHR